MRFGIFLIAARFPGQDDHTALDRACRLVLAAEQAGFDDVWIAEHHFMPYGVCPSALTFAAHALGATTRIDVGTAVTVLSTNHPVAVGEQALLLDNLSGGRFRLGVGRGGAWVDLEVFGTGLDRYEHGFPAALDLLLATVTGPTVRGDGDRFDFRAVPVVPAPSAGVPVLLAATSAGTVGLAAARGLPMLLGMHLGDADKRAMVEKYACLATSAGHDPEPGHVSVVVAHLADSRADAVAELSARMPGWLRDGLAAHVTVDGRPGPARDPDEYTKTLCDLHPVGDVEYCVDRLRTSCTATGIGHVLMMVEGTGDLTTTLRTLERLGETVLPALRGTPGGSDLGNLA